jgi:signal transduction histidine kinase
LEANWAVDPSVANALTEATIQAVQNSILHAGSKAQRELILKATSKELKLVIKDDGVGFRPNRIPQGRLGMKLSIISRVETVGGTVHIASAPRAGSTIILEWEKQ